MKCISATKFHRKSGGAKWRDLLFILRSIQFEWKRYPPLSSRAKPRDLRFRGPLVETRNTILKQNCHLDRSVPDFLSRHTGQGRVCALP
jgi:hypothetical protein